MITTERQEEIRKRFRSLNRCLLAFARYFDMPASLDQGDMEWLFNNDELWAEWYQDHDFDEKMTNHQIDEYLTRKWREYEAMQTDFVRYARLMGFSLYCAPQEGLPL